MQTWKFCIGICVAPPGLFCCVIGWIQGFRYAAPPAYDGVAPPGLFWCVIGWIQGFRYAAPPAYDGVAPPGAYLGCVMVVEDNDPGMVHRVKP